MDTAEAINVLENEKRCVLRESCERNECASCDLLMPAEKILSAYDMAIHAFQEQEERRWIPVTERLPEQGERVLATDGEFVGELYVNSRGKWKRYNDNDYSLMMALDILWWMPLPEPPKDGV